MLLHSRSVEISYELLPVSSEAQDTLDTMPQRGLRRSALMPLLVLFLLLLVSGVTAGVMLKPSKSVGE
jgi:hypothetical protein